MTMADLPIGRHSDPRATILTWLGQLYDQVPDDRWLTVNYGGSFFATDWRQVEDYEAIADAVLRHNERHCVWLGIATRRQPLAQRRGGAEDCVELPGLWLDIDIANPRYHAAPDLPPTADDAMRIVARFPLPPTAVVHSGHGLQVWWLFDEPLPVDDVGDLLDRWETTWLGHAGHLGYGLDNVFDIARVLRVPGTINRKGGDTAPVELVSADWGRRYGIDHLDPHLAEPPPRPEPRERSGGFTGTRPGDLWAAEHTWAELLEADGATYLGEGKSRHGAYQKWARPGVTDHPGGTVDYGGSDVLKVFSSAWVANGTQLEAEGVYTKFGYLAATRHGGDHQRAAKALKQAGWGNTPDPTPARPQAPTPPVTALAAETLPDGLWDARPHLAHIRQAAHSRQRSADAVLHVTLARLAAITPHTVTIPPIVGAPAPLAYYTNVVAPPGVGKSSANQIASDLLPAPEWVPDQIPLGSGEGLAETLFDLVDDIGPNGNAIKVKRQVRHNGFIYADEGQTLAEIGGRNGSTLLPTIRTIWTGGMLGQANASIERRRIIPAGHYVFGMCVALQPTRAGALLADVDAGTPQRFGWASATDPTIPDDPPGWPGPLPWEPPARINTGNPLDVHHSITTEIRASDLARARGAVTIDPLDAHGPLYRLKVAGLLAVLDGRHDINEEDWQLADIIKTGSDTVRTQVTETVAYETTRAEEATRDRIARRHTESQAAEERRKIVDGARKLATKVHTEPDRWTVSEARRGPMRRWSEILEDVIEHAVAEGWVIEHTEPVPGAGGQKRRLKPGETRP
jgi:hypothetical protein